MILQACPDCHRQFDITRVLPGRKLRCACGHVLSVQVPQQVTVRARKCGHCGGSIEPGEEACGFCASKLVELDLDSTLCPECFKRVEANANHCQGCGIRIQPQALQALAAGIQCPRCQGELRLRSLGEASVVECTGCEGLWIAADVFDALCSKAQASPEYKPGSIPAGEQAEGLKLEKVSYIPCLTCCELMLRRNFRYGTRSSHVIIDFCKDHGIWLDKHELDRLMHFVRKSAAGASGGAHSGQAGASVSEGGHSGELNVERPKPKGLPGLTREPLGSAGLLDDLSLGGLLAWFLGDLF